jgi:hypothetical protein
MLWSKQYYHYDVEKWLSMSDGITPANNGKMFGRNHDWKHLKNQDIIAMPINGNIPGMQPGILHFIVFPWQW